NGAPAGGPRKGSKITSIGDGEQKSGKTTGRGYSDSGAGKTEESEEAKDLLTKKIIRNSEYQSGINDDWKHFSTPPLLHEQQISEKKTKSGELVQSRKENSLEDQQSAQSEGESEEEQSKHPYKKLAQAASLRRKHKA
ncbi:unnamed protein product, partial [Gongylonema pulchrum]|uniref:Testis development-related protein n=1 Tax=Gongylonema pulchrum TaxID=637853 RepID=A0A183CXX6_9BILA